MTLWQDGVIAALAAIGVTALLWGLAELLFRKRDKEPGAMVLLPLQDEASGMEYRLQTLLSRRRRLGSRAQILLLDCGLSAENRRRAGLLCRRYDGVTLLTAAELAEHCQSIREDNDYGRTQHGDGNRGEHHFSK